MVRHFMCDECDAVFREEDAGSRTSVLEDGVRPWDRVMTCPECGSSELHLLDNCELCGGPVTDGASQFCEDCRDEIDEAFNAAFMMVSSHGKDCISLKTIMFERAEETGFYGSN